MKASGNDNFAAAVKRLEGAQPRTSRTRSSSVEEGEAARKVDEELQKQAAAEKKTADAAAAEAAKNPPPPPAAPADKAAAPADKGAPPPADKRSRQTRLRAPGARTEEEVRAHRTVRAPNDVHRRGVLVCVSGVRRGTLARRLARGRVRAKTAWSAWGFVTGGVARPPQLASQLLPPDSLRSAP